METTSKIITCLLLNLALFLLCLSAAVSSDPSFHSSMPKGPIRHSYTRFPDVERHCQSVLSSAADLSADAGGGGVRMHQLSFMNGDWSQDAGQAPLLPFHGSYADTAAPGPELLEAVPLASFMLTHTDMAPRRGARTAFNVSGTLSFTITRNSCCSYMEPRASPEFELRPGAASLRVHLQGVYTETKPSLSGDDGGGAGGERVLCMVGDAVLPVRGGNSTDPWDWAKNRGGGGGGDSSFKPPVVSDGNILVVLRYPKTQTPTSRAVRGEMVSTSAESDGAYFDTVRLVSQAQLGGGYDSGYRFQPEDAELDAGAGCSYNPFFHDGGHAMDTEHLNRGGGGSVCDIVYQSAPVNQVMEVIPNLDCEGTDAFCSRVGPFETSRAATSAMADMAFTRSAIVVQGLKCEPTSSVDGGAAARVAAVFRYVPPWEDQPTATKRAGLSGATLSAEGVWTASTGRVCMAACLGAGAGDEACRYRVTLSIRKTFSMTHRGNSIGLITAMDGSHPPLVFQQRVSPREQWYGGSWGSMPMSYKYTKVEQAGELLRRSGEASGFRDSFIAKSILSYPSIVGAADDMVSLSNLADDLNLRFQFAVKPPFVPEWIEEPFFELQILSVGALVGSYSPKFQAQAQSSMRIELLGRVVHTALVEKQEILNVSAELVVPRDFSSPRSIMSLEGVYSPEDGRMYLIGCRNVHAPWRFLSQRTDLEEGMDCSVEVTVEYPPTTTRWLISRPAKVTVASTRDAADGDALALRFNATELRTLPVVYRDQRREELTEPVVEGLLCVAMLSAAIAATAAQLRHLGSHPDVAPYVSLAMLGVQALGYAATLVTDAKMLPAWPARRYRSYYGYGGDPDRRRGWDMDCSVKALTLAVLLLTARLAQKVWRSRARARARAPLETGRVPGDGGVLLCSSGVHLAGLLFVLAVHWLMMSTPAAHPPREIYGEQQGMGSGCCCTRAAVVERYAGVVKEWFLLPQVVGNALWRVNCKPLAARYYAGVTAVWLLPHVYGYLRPPVVNMYSEARHDGMDLYSKAGAVVVPVVGFVLALAVFVQQRWNYKIVGWAMGTEKNKLQHVY